VNGIATSKGGTHVNHVVDQIIEKLIASMPKKNSLAIKPFQVKAHLNVYINCLI
jgi:DNA topoisomerase-2